MTNPKLRHSLYDVAFLRYASSGNNSCLPGFDGQYDLTGPNGQSDCKVDILDLMALAEAWLSCGLYPSCN